MSRLNNLWSAKQVEDPHDRYTSMDRLVIIIETTSNG
jgi:hypothetical protein